MLDIRDVGFAYGGAWAVDGCTFVVPKARVTGLVGPNGAGKSTLIEVVSGGLRPRRGTVTFDGEDITGLGRTAVARKGIIRTFQEARILGRLPVIENVMLAAQGQVGESALWSLFGVRRWQAQETALRQRADELLSWLGLGDVRERQAGTLSGGQRRLLDMARALMAGPKLLLLDEPSAGVFPTVAHLIAVRVREIVASGITVLVVAHNMAFLGEIADDVVVMAQGKVLTRGTLDEVRAHQAVIAAYLGT